MDFNTHLKSAAWTGAEVGAVIVGGVATTEMLDGKKVFKKAFALHPEWFEGGRDTAPFEIKHWGGLKFAGAALASTYVQNPWLKLVLMGVAFQGGLEEARVLSWDREKQLDRFQKVGSKETDKIDAELKALANKYRRSVKGAESSVANAESSVARSYDDDFDMGMGRAAFSLDSSDGSAAY